MSEILPENKADGLHGLNCPNCGGMVSIPEGQIVVKCPYCEMRSLVHGERGLLRYQVAQKTPRENAMSTMRQFLKSNLAIASDAAGRAKLDEIFLVHLPFWTVWGRVAAWVFGEKRVGSGDNKRYEPREVRVVQEMTWNGAACDVGEFGVNQVPVVSQDLQPFDPDQLHLTGIVFEPVGSESEARAQAEGQFQNQVRQRAGLDRLAQVFVRVLRQRMALVYHPLWVMRYLYRGRSFQVVVDGHSGKVLYGKAPGNTLYRAAVLVLGMAIGAFLAVDVASLLLYLFADSDSDVIWGAGVVFIIGLGLMLAAYRAFRYGEQYEYRSGGKTALQNVENPLEMITKVKDVEEWINRYT
jgi:DNA-directed RNA polymerase subunit RPC12/RpoP